MEQLKRFVGKLIGPRREPANPLVGAGPVAPEAQPHKITGLYEKGDVINRRYQIHGVLGKGGFGVVYLAQSLESGAWCALKTFRDELLSSAAARSAFRKEALLWINLDAHPFIVAAQYVDEVSGRLFVQMDYLAPDEQRRVSLADHLAASQGPLDLGQTLKWGVEFCLGMEHAQSRGIACHRDIKPSNIMISRDGTLKISDFGLATAAEAAWRQGDGAVDSFIGALGESGPGFSLMREGPQARCGSPGYMAPEVYRCHGADVRSDIYSFGLVLWQMATGHRMPPFITEFRGDLAAFLKGTYERQLTGQIPPANELLDPVIQRCLHPQPTERWSTFQELRQALEPLYLRVTGKKLEMPKRDENNAPFWNHKGASLISLDRFEEAIACFDRALAIDSRDENAWTNKGIALRQLGRTAAAVHCCDQALAINPRQATTWNNRGSLLSALQQFEDAIKCYDQALALDPAHVTGWTNKGLALSELGRRKEAIACYDRALAIDPRSRDAYYNKGISLAALKRPKEAIACYEQAIAIDPRYADAWLNRGALLAGLGHLREAQSCYDRVLELSPQHALAYFNKAIVAEKMGAPREAVHYYRRFIEVAPPGSDKPIETARRRIELLGR